MNVYMDCIVDRTFNPKDCEIVLAVVHQEFYRLSTCHLDILRGSVPASLISQRLSGQPDKMKKRCNARY